MTRELKVSKICMDKESTLKELKLGYLNLADGLFDLAQTNFDMVILSDAENADAFWGLILCKCQIRNEQALKHNATLYKNIVYLKEYENALNYADETQKAIFENLTSEIKKINEGDNY